MFLSNQKVITSDEARGFLPPGHELDSMFPKDGATCGRQLLEYMLGIAYPLLQEYRRVIVGQRAMTTYTLIGLFAVGDTDPDHMGGGHVYYLGLPGTGKSLLAKVPGKVVRAEAKRIQGTVDLLPSDITGAEVVQIDSETGRRYFQFRPGPVFSNILLFDEISRAPARSQSGMLECLSEGTATVGGTTHHADPFLIATANPIESEGQNSLPDALRDRLMFCVLAQPFTAHDYTEILRRTDTFKDMHLEPIADFSKVIEAREYINASVYVSQEIEDFMGFLAETINEADHRGLLRGVRVRAEYSEQDEIVKPGSFILSGRSVTHLRGAARALAALRYRNYVTYDDVQKVLLPVIRHRTHFTPNALFHFPDKMRATLKGMFQGRSGKTEASEFLLAEIQRQSWDSAMQMMRGRRVVTA